MAKPIKKSKKPAPKKTSPTTTKNDKPNPKTESLKASLLELAETTAKPTPKPLKNPEPVLHSLSPSSEEDQIPPTPEYHELVELNRKEEEESGLGFFKIALLGMGSFVILMLIYYTCSGDNENREPHSIPTASIEPPKQEAQPLDHSTPDLQKSPKTISSPTTAVSTPSPNPTVWTQKKAISYVNNLRVLFIKQDAILLEETKQELNKLFTVLQKFPNFKVRITGHTCFIGEKDENKLLSEKRAQLVSDYLIQKGISANQLSTRGMGETAEIQSNYTEAGRIQNRRVEFRVLSIY